MQLDEIVKSIGELPPFPQTAMKAMKLVDDPDASLTELKELIAADQAMTAHILKIVNSAMYSFPKEISTLSHAVSILGIKRICSTVMAASVQLLFNSKGSRSPNLTTQLLWTHSWGTAVAARAIAVQSGYHNVEEAFTGGLLHDIGKTIMVQTHERDYLPVIETVYRGETEFCQVEIERFGFSHVQLGSLLAERWRLPSQLVDAILNHHGSPAAGKFAKLSAIVSLSNLMMRVLGIGFIKNPELKIEESEPALFLRIDAPVLQQMIAKLKPALAVPSAASVG